VEVPGEVGQQLFRIGELLGTGATGAVYAGVGQQGAQVAVKFLHEHLTEDPTMVARFQREAKLAARIDSEFVAPVLASGRTRGLYWIAYRRLVGETLEARLHRERVLPSGARRTIITQVLRGLAAAHAAGVVHRDVKPANVFLERLGSGERACVLDFGVSKSRGGSSATSQHPLTSDTETLGSVSYMAPEQIGGSAHADARADVYAVGVVAFRAMAGRLPFAGSSRTVVLHAKLNTDPPTLAQVTGAVWPPRIEAFLARALSRDLTGRYKSADEARDAWEEAARDDLLPGHQDVGATAGETVGDDVTEVEPPPPDSRTNA
jgi:serine/threonine-protein kinase